jgi:indole-3-glycerol phosphate synthase
MFLEKIVKIKRQEIETRKTPRCEKELEGRIAHLPAPRDFMGSILRHGPMALIAEIKRASPSLGMIREDVDPRQMAHQYEGGGACAISVLTEAHFFKGDLSFLHEVKKEMALPVLQKDFIIDPFQIYEGRVSGADAILLIASLLDQEQLRDFAHLVMALKMVPLVEVHDEEDLEKTLTLHPLLLGINNRNLRTFEVDLGTTFRLKKKIPSGIKVISESGIKSSHDVRLLKEAGVAGILVGEILVRSPDPGSKIKELLEI